MLQFNNMIPLLGMCWSIIALITTFYYKTLAHFAYRRQGAKKLK